MEASDGGWLGTAGRGWKLCGLPAALRRCHALFERLAIRGRRCRPIAPRGHALRDRYLLPPGSRCSGHAKAFASRLVPHVSIKHTAGHVATGHARSPPPGAAPMLSGYYAAAAAAAASAGAQQQQQQPPAASRSPATSQSANSEADCERTSSSSRQRLITPSPPLNPGSPPHRERINEEEDRERDEERDIERERERERERDEDDEEELALEV